jgi:hypothetical protein
MLVVPAATCSPRVEALTAQSELTTDRSAIFT